MERPLPPIPGEEIESSVEGNNTNLEQVSVSSLNSENNLNSYLSSLEVENSYVKKDSESLYNYINSWLRNNYYTEDYYINNPVIASEPNSLNNSTVNLNDTSPLSINNDEYTVNSIDREISSLIRHLNDSSNISVEGALESFIPFFFIPSIFKNKILDLFKLLIKNLYKLY